MMATNFELEYGENLSKIENPAYLFTNLNAGAVDNDLNQLENSLLSCD